MKTGEPLTGMLFVYAATGSIGGYTSARLYKLCEGENFKLNGILTSSTLSGSMVVIYCFFNMVANAIGSSCSDALGVVELIALWMCLVGLSYWGSLLGEKAPCIQVPTGTSEKARPIPVTRWTKLKKWAGFASGMICFGVIYVELHFLMTAIWLNETYLGFGYLLTVTLLAMIVCAESAICLCYFQLHSEDHEWWWMAFSNGASVGGYMIVYTFFYRFKRIELVGIYSNSAYFTCMFLATISIGMVCGSIGFLSCLWFTRTIYSANIDDESDDDDEEIAPLTKDVSASVEASDLQ